MSENRWSDVITVPGEGDYVGVDEADAAMRTVLQVYEDTLQKMRTDNARLREDLETVKLQLTAMKERRMKEDIAARGRIAELEEVATESLAQLIFYKIYRPKHSAWWMLTDERQEEYATLFDSG